MEALENLSGTSSASSEQHVAYKDHKELRPARQNRDATDLVKFISWLKTHNPFDPKYQTKRISVFSGMSADETINCNRADGSELQKAMVGKNFAELTLKHSAKVLPLAAMTSTIQSLSLPHHLQPSSMVAIYSMWWFGQPLSHIKLSSTST